MEATNARLSRLLHILHPLGIKFATSANIWNKAAYHIHWLSKLATSANKCHSKTNPELKPLQKISRKNILGTHNAGKMLSKLINFLLFGA